MVRPVCVVGLGPMGRPMARHLIAKGFDVRGWVDAPVSGGPESASDGTLAVMAGGTEVVLALASDNPYR